MVKDLISIRPSRHKEQKQTKSDDIQLRTSANQYHSFICVICMKIFMCFSMTMTINFHFFFSLQDYFIWNRNYYCLFVHSCDIWQCISNAKLHDLLHWVFHTGCAYLCVRTCEKSLNKYYHRKTKLPCWFHLLVQFH